MRLRDFDFHWFVFHEFISPYLEALSISAGGVAGRSLVKCIYRCKAVEWKSK